MATTHPTSVCINLARSVTPQVNRIELQLIKIISDNLLTYMKLMKIISTSVFNTREIIYTKIRFGLS